MHWLSTHHLCWLVWLLPVLGTGWTVVHAPTWQEPYRLSVALDPGQSIVLGREELTALQADSDHVRVSRTGQGSWRLANLVLGKQVLWQPGGRGQEQVTREWPLAPGARLTVGIHTLEVATVQPERLELHGEGQHWAYDGLNLYQNGQRLPECHDNWRNRWRRYLINLSGVGRWLQRPLRLGGGVYCADRLGLADVPVDTALLVAGQTGFVLRSGSLNGRTVRLPVTVAAGTPQAESLWQRAVPLAVGDRLMMGRTRYEVTQTAPALELTILSRAWRWLPGASLPVALPGVSVHWQTPVWLWPPTLDSLVWPIGLGLVLFCLGRIVARIDRQTAAALGLAGVGLGFYLWRLTVPPLWPALLAWSVLGLGLIKVRSPWSRCLLMVLILLLGIGGLALLQLGSGAGESSGWRFSNGVLALVGTFGWLSVAGWRLARPWQLGRWPDRCLIGTAVGLLGGVALGLLMTQMLWGDESGWCGFQPFELAKLALVTSAAWALAVGGFWRRRPVGASAWVRELYHLAPVGLLALVSGFALMFLRDFSPLLLLGCWVMVLAWAKLRLDPRPHRRWLGQLMVLALLLAAVAGLAWLREQPERFPLDFQADRIRVWAEPEQYPHAGYQLRRALEAIRAGGWQGTVWSEPVNGRIMTLPAVEDDFMPAFFLNRYGGLAALGLAALQAIWIGLLLIIANRAALGVGPADQVGATWRAFIYFSLYGGAGWLMAHFVVSWGANVGFLPVMGQPMPLLSVGGSHLILFALPIVALAVAVEEKTDDDPP